MQGGKDRYLIWSGFVGKYDIEINLNNVKVTRLINERSPGSSVSRNAGYRPALWFKLPSGGESVSLGLF